MYRDGGFADPAAVAAAVRRHLEADA